MIIVFATRVKFWFCPILVLCLLCLSQEILTNRIFKFEMPKLVTSFTLMFFYISSCFSIGFHRYRPPDVLLGATDYTSHIGSSKC